MTRLEMVDLGQLPEQQPSLHDLHQKIDALSGLKNFSIGWEIINKGNHKITKGVYGTLMTLAALATETYGGSAIFFGGLALKQGINDLKDNGKASVIGHPSEWINTGLFVMSLPIRGPYSELSAVGKRKQVEKIFRAYLSSAETKNLQQAVYEDYLETLPSLSQPYYLLAVHLPRGLPREIHPEIERTHPLYQDYYLQHIYKQIETEWKATGNWANFRKGCGVVSDYYGGVKTWGIRVVAGLAALYMLPMTVAYGAGIFWSAEEGLAEKEAGRIPYIGGHCLEWGVELWSIFKGSYGYFKEIKRVGEAQTLVNIFNEKIGLVEEDKYLSREEKVERLERVKRWTVRQFPNGSFYSLPSSHIYPTE